MTLRHWLDGIVKLSAIWHPKLPTSGAIWHPKMSAPKKRRSKLIGVLITCVQNNAQSHAETCVPKDWYIDRCVDTCVQNQFPITCYQLRWSDKLCRRNYVLSTDEFFFSVKNC